MEPVKIMVTGANGFIGKNLCLKLEEEKYHLLPISKASTDKDIKSALDEADFIFHLAGVNRALDESEFVKGNVDFTALLCNYLKDTNRKTAIVYTSSIQAEINSPYGNSKRESENIILDYNRKTQASVFIFRLPNVFGKWCRPNYNSVVATFCHNIAHGLPISVNDPHKELQLVYIDHVIDTFIQTMRRPSSDLYCTITPTYKITVGELAAQIERFKISRESLMTEKVGEGLIRSLYSTYVTYYLPNQFIYELPLHRDERGVFVEMLKTWDSGQFSFFTAHPGVTRGGHYHHSKSEKFLVVEGKALFNFRHMITNETFSYETSGDCPQVVETIPGWAHDITNIGNEKMIVMIWANEIFNPLQPDTISSRVAQ